MTGPSRDPEREKELYRQKYLMPNVIIKFANRILSQHSIPTSLYDYRDASIEEQKSALERAIQEEIWDKIYVPRWKQYYMKK